MDDARVRREFAKRKRRQLLVPLTGLAAAAAVGWEFSNGSGGDLLPMMVKGLGPAVAWGPFAVLWTGWNFRCPACGEALSAFDLEGSLAIWRSGADCPACHRQLA